MTTSDLFYNAVKALLDHYGDDIILANEIGIANGSCIMDLMAIKDDYIIGVEIKGPTDTKARLSKQCGFYQAICRDFYVSSSVKQFTAMGSYLAYRDGVSFIMGDKVITNSLNNWQAPSMIAKCLWKKDVLEVVKTYMPLTTLLSKYTKDELLKCCVNIPLKHLEKELVRNWRMRTDILVKNDNIRNVLIKGNYERYDDNTLHPISNTTIDSVFDV